MTTVVCNNPAHGVQTHIAGTAAARACQRWSGGSSSNKVSIPSVREALVEGFQPERGQKVRITGGDNTGAIGTVTDPEPDRSGLVEVRYSVNEALRGRCDYVTRVRPDQMLSPVEDEDIPVAPPRWSRVSFESKKHGQQTGVVTSFEPDAYGCVEVSYTPFSDGKSWNAVVHVSKLQKD